MTKPANLFSPADTPHEFIYVPDLGPVVADLLGRDDVWNQCHNVAGSGVITGRFMAAAGLTHG